MRFALWLFALVCIGAVSADAHFHVDNQTKFMMDEFGRVRFFHGLNAVYKIPPWYPTSGDFDPITSLNDKDAADIASWGFNHLRLGVMWPGVQPKPTGYDADYLTYMGKLIDMLAAHNISTLVDCHQDLYSRKFCGEGAPDWAVSDYATTKKGLPFAEPVFHKFTLDPNTQYPQINECLKNSFFEYYVSDQVSRGFQELYSNKNSVQDKFVEFWADVVGALRTHDGVMGYELINEPWVGDFYSNPLLIAVPGYADRHNLDPMYKRLHTAIRALDDKRLVFFEPTVADIWTSGFNAGPGGHEYDDRQVFSYHIYCGVNNNKTSHRTTLVCGGEDDLEWHTRLSDIKRVGCGSFMTEFGASSETTTAIQELTFMTTHADEHLQSWDYWQYKYFNDITTANSQESFYRPDGSFESEKVKTLSRTYAHAIAGIPSKMSFDPKTSAFTLVYTANAATRPTEVFLNEKWYYPRGFNVQISPASAAHYAHVATNRVEIVHDRVHCPAGTQLTITITASS